MDAKVFNEKTLNLIEDRFLQGCLGDIELSASVLEILRRVLHDNARLTLTAKPGDPSSTLESADDNMPDYGGKIVNFK